MPGTTLRCCMCVRVCVCVHLHGSICALIDMHKCTPQAMSLHAYCCVGTVQMHLSITH